MSALGSLVVKLALEHAEFTKGLDKSSQEALRFAKNSQDSFNKFEQSAKASFNSAVKSTAGLVAGLLGVTSAIGALNQSINQLAVLDDLSQKTGSTVEELSRLQKVAQQFGQDFGAVEGSLTKLARGIGDLDDEGGKANKALNALGISSKDLSGNLRDPAELMVEVAKRLQNYQDGASKAAIATDLFGKAGVDLLPFLNDLAENVDRFNGVSAESAARAAAFQDRLGSLKEQANSAFQSIAINVLPTLDSMLQKFIDNAEKGNVFLGVLTSIGELGKSALFGSDRSRQQQRFEFGIPAEMTRIASQLKNQNLDATERIKLQTELQFLAKEQNALSIQLNKVQAKQESPYTNPTTKDALIYNSGDGKAAMEKAQREADKARQEALRAIQDEVAEELEAADTISAYKQDKLEQATKAKKELDEKEYERQLKQLDLLQAQANKNFDEAQKKVKELENEAKQSAEEINRSLTDALLRGFESGKSFAQNFRDTLVNMFKTLVLQPVIKMIIDASGVSKFITMFTGALGTVFSGNAVAGQDGGISGIFSSIKDIFSSSSLKDTISSPIVSSIQDLGVFLSNGNGGLGDIIGGFLGENASAISDGFGYIGAALQLAQGNIGGAAGAAIGTFFGGPIGGAIGSFLGGALGGLFGGGLPPRVTESRGASSIGGVNTFYNGTDPGKRKLGAASSLDALNQTFLNNINTLFGAFDINSNIDVNSLLTKKKNTRSRFGANLDGQFLGFDDVSFGKKGTIEEAFASLVERALGSYTVRAIQASTLPEGIKKFFDNLTKKEDVAETINTLISMKKALVDLPPIFNAVRNAIDTTAYTSTIAQLQAQFQATQTFVDLFYSDTEKFNIFTQQLNTQLAALNQTLPTSRDQYRALVESINVVDAATRDQFNGLIALAPAMNQYFEYLEQQADGINQVNDALAQALDRNLFSTYADFVTAQANASADLSYTGSIGDLSVRRAQGDAELANAVKSLVAQQDRTDQILAEIASATRKSAEITQRWDGEGQPETRVY